MNPSVGENGPQFESLPIPSSGEQASDQSVEKNIVSSPENSPQAQTVAAAGQAANSFALPSQAVSTGVIADDKPLPSQGAPAANAQDADRIEKEWVDKAKAVIAKTRDDPYEQKIEMSKVKAEYISKRFNKTLRTDDAVAK
ncbi:hypothetical protein KW789_00695 [Candidatus Saccharibacteria bacterium]|jgi:hypothetical protein|nr:hypothetical protein [Candidatus Saccharibacteria bacterium]